MSRSIGDLSSHRVGVIATPVTAEMPLGAYGDQFVVVASDGVWDVMENHEVINFVEKYRH